VKLSADTLFDFDKAVLKPEGRSKLDELAALAKDVKLESFSPSVIPIASARMPTPETLRASRECGEDLPRRQGHRSQTAFTPKARASVSR